MTRYISSLKQTLVLIFSLVSFVSTIRAQESNSVIQFTDFTGPVFFMPKLTIKEGKWKKVNFQEYYSDTIYSYEQIGEVRLEALNIPNSKIDTFNFPGVDRKTRFCMILKSEATVKNSGCYELSLSSDDGSRLWINEIQVINNDGGHGMRTKKDTLFLEQGVHDVKLWYFQGLPYNLGLTMETLKFEDNTLCADTISTAPPILYVLEGALFEHDKYSLAPENLTRLQKIADTINLVRPPMLEIIGHTDNTGSDQYNIELSMKRASSVENLIASLIDTSNIKVNLRGQGSQFPISSNQTEEGRQLNRRVEILFKEN